MQRPARKLFLPHKTLRLMTENGDLKIPNPLHSYSGLFCFSNGNIINKVINISLTILLIFIIIEFSPPMSLF